MDRLRAHSYTLLSGSAFAGCFFEAQWQSVQVVWNSNGGFISLLCVYVYLHVQGEQVFF